MTTPTGSYTTLTGSYITFDVDEQDMVHIVDGSRELFVVSALDLHLIVDAVVALEPLRSALSPADFASVLDAVVDIESFMRDECEKPV